MEAVPVHYKPGGAYGLCQRCGFKRRLSALAVEWSGLRVCVSTCYDPRPPELSPPSVTAEGLPHPDASPETPNVFVDQNLGPEDL